MDISKNIPQLHKKGGLSSYLKKVHNYPMLEAEEEFTLAKKWHKEKDPKAMDALVKSHMRLVSKIANGYRGYGLPLHDLVAEGSIGMIQAIERFDPEKGFRLSTYARWWIRAAIKDYVMKTWSLVKIGTTTTQKKLFFKLRSIKGKLEKELGREPLREEHIKRVSEDMGVDEKDVAQMFQRLSGSDYSLNARINYAEDEVWQDWLVDESQDIEDNAGHEDELKKRRQIFEEAMQCLNQREHSILKERRLSEPPKTLEEISQTYSISRERVRQIEVAAFNKLQKEIRETATKDHFLN